MADDPSSPGGERLRTFLVVSAHPDDADFGVAGTAARLASQGHAVHYLICTHGEEGAENPTLDPEELKLTREAEQRAAAEVLGLAGMHFLDFPDGRLEPSLALRKEIVRAIRRLQADVVLSLDPRTLVNDEATYLNHPDHRAAGQAALDAVFPAAGNPFAFRELEAEGLVARPVREVWLYFTNTLRAHVKCPGCDREVEARFGGPSHWVDITETLDQKIRALECHTSQIGGWAASGELRTEITRWAEESAKDAPFPCRYAESFVRIVLQAEEEKVPEAAALEAQEEDSA